MQQRRCAIVAIRQAAGDQRRSRAGLRSRDRRGQSGRTAADNDNVELLRRRICCSIHVKLDYSGRRAVQAAPRHHDLPQIICNAQVRLRLIGMQAGAKSAS